MVENALTEQTPLVEQPTLSRQFSWQSGRPAKARTIDLLQLARSQNRQHATPDSTRDTAICTVMKHIEAEGAKDVRFFLFAVLAIVGHVLGGSITLHWLEGWSFYDAVYFCVVTTTTVGYGDITPKMALSKLYVVYYVIFSIAIISALLGYIVGLLLDQQEELLLEVAVGGRDRHGVSNADLEADLSEEESQRRILEATKSLDASDYYGLGYSIFSLLVLMMVGFICFVTLEGLTAIDALYATVVSASTVGFGDFEPTTNSSKLFATIWLCFSTVAVGKVVADFTNAHVKAKQRAMTRRLLVASMNRESMAAMDADGDGQVDKFEFVTEMLIHTGKLDRLELNAMLLRFKTLDTDASGQIDRNDLM